ncbi:VIT family protein [Candidatus Saccharibacteria bacterium]|nr:VIT family protein [Candidatus Saccharibacteria bacterium]
MIKKDKSKDEETHPEQHGANEAAKTNWLRAAVLGANDGIVSISGLVVGVAGAAASQSVILAAGVAGVIAGALSMAAGEYVSVSSQRDVEKALLAKEAYELKNFPEEELEELKGIYKRKGLSDKTAALVAHELTEHDPFKAHVEAELGIDPNNLTSPTHAAFASAASFTAGALIPLIAIILPPESIRIPVTFASVIFALIITGVLSAWVGKSDPVKATVRVVLGGVLAMVVTYAVGKIFHISGI